MIRGKHDIRVGVGMRANQMNVETNAFQDGLFIPFGLTFDDAADVLLGQLGGGFMTRLSTAQPQVAAGSCFDRLWRTTGASPMISL